MKVRDLIKEIEQDGWVLVRMGGDHRQYTRPEKLGTVTIPGHPGDDMLTGTLNSVLKQAGFKK